MYAPGFPRHTRGFVVSVPPAAELATPTKQKTFARVRCFPGVGQIFFVLRQRLPRAIESKIVAANFAPSWSWFA